MPDEQRRDPQIIPATSAMHGITVSQNVTRAVAERIAALHSATSRSRAMAWGFFILPLATAIGAAILDPLTLFVTVYIGLCTMPIGIAVHHYRKKASREAARLDRNRDVAWVSPKDGLVFFTDEGLFVEKRGGFKPYGAATRRYNEVTVASGVLTLHGMDSQSGATYSMEIQVPSGWSDDDTNRVRDKVARFTAVSA